MLRFSFYLILLFSCNNQPKENKQTFIPIEMDTELSSLCETATPSDCNCSIDFDVKDDSLKIDTSTISLYKRIKFYTSDNETQLLSIDVYAKEFDRELSSYLDKIDSCKPLTVSSEKYLYWLDTCNSSCFDKATRMLSSKCSEIISKVKTALK